MEENLSGRNVSYSLICLSHLRWDFVYQRPQHLLSRFARERNVYFLEEPVFVDGKTHLETSRRDENLTILAPHISHSDKEKRNLADIQREMLDDFIKSEKINDFVLWFYTPMAMDFASHLKPLATIFDCMDELSAFKFAPRELIENEKKLLEKADLVFTGGQSLYEAKKNKHPKVFAFPSSIDAAHFRRARSIETEPEDQKSIPHPRFGFCGVIDERMDIELLGAIADLRPEWQFVMIGPVVKIASEDLPRRENIHYLGGKKYQDLPAYLAGWDVAMMPFAMNESTRFISPTKTPEYLAAGLPVVSTPIRDVVRPYGEIGLTHIAATAEEFVAAGEKALNEDMYERIQKADEFLSHNSWDKTQAEMERLINEAIAEQPRAAAQSG